MTFTGDVTTTAPTDFAFRLEARMLGGPAGDVMQTVELYDYVADRWELVDVRSVQTTDQTIDFTPPGNKSRFIQPKTNIIRARVDWSSTRFSGAPFFWSIDVDEASWLLNN